VTLTIRSARLCPLRIRGGPPHPREKEKEEGPWCALLSPKTEAGIVDSKKKKEETEGGEKSRLYYQNYFRKEVSAREQIQTWFLLPKKKKEKPLKIYARVAQKGGRVGKKKAQTQKGPYLLAAKLRGEGRREIRGQIWPIQLKQGVLVRFPVTTEIPSLLNMSLSTRRKKGGMTYIPRKSEKKGTGPSIPQKRGDRKSEFGESEAAATAHSRKTGPGKLGGNCTTRRGKGPWFNLREIKKTKLPRGGRRRGTDTTRRRE